MNAVELLALALMSAGAAFTLLAAVGVVRMPDVYCRLSATSKAAPFGVGLLLAGAALLAGDAGFAAQAAAVAVFLAITSPVSAHALARAAHRSGVPTCAETARDEADGAS